MCAEHNKSVQDAHAKTIREQDLQRVEELVGIIMGDRDSYAKTCGQDFQRMKEWTESETQHYMNFDASNVEASKSKTLEDDIQGDV